MARPKRILPSTAEGSRSVDAATDAANGESLTDLAYREIKAAILEGALPPGLMASEQQIATRLAMSRTPVHHAIVRLEQDGWIQLLPRRGLQIAPISPADMHDVYETLLVLEVAAAGRLASLGLRDGDPALVAIETACLEGEAALTKGDLSAWLAADARFHTLVVESSGNRHITRLARSMLEYAQRARQVTLKLRPHPSSSNEDHRAILAALKAGDEALARERMRAHRSRGMAVLLPILEALSVNAEFLHGS
jgi:DNA-binding GntR family transcriptional regulator